MLVLNVSLMVQVAVEIFLTLKNSNWFDLINKHMHKQWPQVCNHINCPSPELLSHSDQRHVTISDIRTKPANINQHIASVWNLLFAFNFTTSFEQSSFFIYLECIAYLNLYKKRSKI